MLAALTIGIADSKPSATPPISAGLSLLFIGSHPLLQVCALVCSSCGLSRAAHLPVPKPPGGGSVGGSVGGSIGGSAEGAAGGVGGVGRPKLGPGGGIGGCGLP